MIFTYIMSGGFLMLAGAFAVKGKYNRSTVFGIISFLTFAIHQMHGGSGGQSEVVGKPTAEQIVCWLFGLSFFILAIIFAKKDILSYAFVIFLISSLTCACGLSGVQALLKTHLLWQATKSLNEYGEKIDKFQTTMADMQQRLDMHQASLETNQIDITNTLSLVIANQTSLSNQVINSRLLSGKLDLYQTNIDAQQKKLADVEYWVENLYKNVTNETYSIADTNNFGVIPFTNGNFEVIIKLEQTPIVGSIEAYARNSVGEPEQRFQTIGTSYNLLFCELLGYNSNSLITSVRYVSDKRSNKKYKHLPKINDEIFFRPDGIVQVKTLQPK